MSEYVGPDTIQEADTELDVYEQIDFTHAAANQAGRNGGNEIYPSLNDLPRDCEITISEYLQPGVDATQIRTNCSDGYETTNRSRSMHVYEGLTANVWMIRRAQSPSVKVLDPLRQAISRIKYVILCILLLLLFTGFYFLGYLNGAASNSLPMIFTSTKLDETIISSTSTVSPHSFKEVNGTPTSDYTELNSHVIGNTTTAMTWERNHTNVGSSFMAYCQSATNLTDGWRKDYNGSNMKPGGHRSTYHGYSCDLHEDLKWFRFKGNAGQKMLDYCPEYKSCGTRYPYWTEAAIPDVIGEVVTGSVYGVLNENCKHLTRSILIMRCSMNNNYDVIYKYVGRFYDYCLSGFCGMD